MEMAVEGAGVTLSSNYNSLMLIYAVAYTFAISILYIIAKRSPNTSYSPHITNRPNTINSPHKILDPHDQIENDKLILFGILGFALVVRLLSSTVIEGWPNDIYSNKYWAKAAATNLFNFYNSGWCDYPPFFIYILALIGKLSNLVWLNLDFTILIKLPSILADLVCSYLIYHMAHSRLGRIPALAAGFAYSLHPVVFIDSTIWGQVDSFFTMIILAALILLTDKRPTASAVFFALAVLMKPQGIFFLPVLLFELIKLKSAVNFIKAAAAGFITAVVVVLPFALHMEPLWIFKLYLGTASEYTSAVMNAFNIFGLAGANFVNGSTIPFLFSYTVWGLIFTTLVVIIAAYLHLKSVNPYSPFLTAILLNAGAFIFSTKMHERYMYPVIALSLIAVLLVSDKRLLIIFSGFSITIFANVHILFKRMLATDVAGSHLMGPEIYPVIAVFSIMNIVLFVYLVKVYADIGLRRPKDKQDNELI